MFLTRLPVPVALDHCDGRLARAAPWFPVVGLLVGGIAGGALLLAAAVLPMPLAAGFAIAAGVLVTGALHEDGLADCCDGLGGGRNREHALEIMRDSRIGTFAGIGLGLLARPALGGAGGARACRGRARAGRRARRQPRHAAAGARRRPAMRARRGSPAPSPVACSARRRASPSSCRSPSPCWPGRPGLAGLRRRGARRRGDAGACCCAGSAAIRATGSAPCSSWPRSPR